MRRIATRAVTAGAIVLGCAIAVGCLPLADGGSEGGSSPETAGFGLVSPREAVVLIEQGAKDTGFVLLDIRTAAEVEAGHISGAETLDYYAATFEDDLAQLNRDGTYLIYCRTGNRTGKAFRIMTDLGFDKVYDLDGGITEWMRLGYSTCQGRLDAEHACTEVLPASGAAG